MTTFRGIAFTGAAILLSIGGIAGSAAAQSATIHSQSHAYCEIHDNLSRGAYSASVSALQDFLSEQGFFSQASIGIFGPVTLRAVVAYQAANNLPATGFVGPMTRALILKHCPPVQQNITIYSIAPASGPVGTQVSIDGFGFSNDNTIHFGSGVIMHVPISSSIAIACTTDPHCKGGIHQTLKFTVPNGLNPVCFYSEPRCMVLTRQTVPGDYQVYVESQYGTSNAVNFTVTGATSSPVRIDAVSPQSAAVGAQVTITGSGFAGGAVVHAYQNGQPYGTIGNVSVPDAAHVVFTVPDWIGAYCHPDAMCMALAKSFPVGSYSFAVETASGISNQLAFTKTGSANGAGVSVSGLDAPTMLAIGTPGTWTVHATSMSTSANLHYSVTWGDEVQTAGTSIMAPQPTTVQNSATFTHAYQRSGTYAVQFTVGDDSGHSANISTTVVVTPLY